MTAPRALCAARVLFGDRHQLGEGAWLLAAPDGREIPLCSAACVLSWVCYQSLPAEIAEQRADGEGVAA